MLERLKSSLLGRLLVTYFDGSLPHLAPGLAFNLLVAMFPILLGMLALLGLLVRSDDLSQKVESLLLSAFPADAQVELGQLVHAVRTHAESLGVLAIVGFAWSATTLFSSLEYALDQVYGDRPRSILQRRLVGLRLIGVFAGVTLFSLAANWAVAYVPSFPLLGFLAGWWVMTSMLMFVYRVAPNHHLSLAAVFPGAVLAGLCVEALTLAFPIFWGLTHQANPYGRGLALLFVLQAWLYLLSHLLLLGALFNRLRSPYPVAAAAAGFSPSSVPSTGE